MLRNTDLLNSENAQEGLSFAWAFALLSSLYEEGVRHVFISPGSRSTSFILAIEAHGGFQPHVILDERIAGFAALGFGKYSSTPAALLCTSGTAALNYAPAIQEAASSGTPLVVLTADRPASLRQTGSSQTIDQLKLYGDRVVFFYECGTPVSETISFRRLSLAGKQAVQEAIQQRGVSHLNVAFDKPFEPALNQWEKAQYLGLYQREKASASQLDSGKNGFDVEMPDRVADLLKRVRKPLLIAGPLNASDPLFRVGSALFEEIRAINNVDEPYPFIPILSDPGSCFSTEFSDSMAHLLSGWITKFPEAFSEFTPDLIIQIGDTPYSAALITLLDHWSEIPHLLITSRFTWQDPVSWEPLRWVTSSHEAVSKFVKQISTGTDPNWTPSWALAQRQVLQEQRSTLLTPRPKGASSLDSHSHVQDSQTDLTSIQLFTNWLPIEIPLFLSNSMIPRDYAFLQSILPSRTIFVNRGAAGIDGITSTAAGVQLAGNHPVALLTGDLAFLHDAGGLTLCDQVTAPLVIGVIQNGGGTIFRKLPVYKTFEKDAFVTYFETPQRVEFETLCRAYHVAYKKILNAEELKNEQFPTTPGIYVYEFITDPDRSYQERTQWIQQFSSLEPVGFQRAETHGTSSEMNSKRL